MLVENGSYLTDYAFIFIWTFKEIIEIHLCQNIDLNLSLIRLVYVAYFQNVNLFNNNFLIYLEKKVHCKACDNSSSLWCPLLVWVL